MIVANYIVLRRILGMTWAEFWDGAPAWLIAATLRIVQAQEAETAERISGKLRVAAPKAMRAAIHAYLATYAAIEEEVRRGALA